MDTHETLRNLGLENKEIEAYLALLKLGEATVLEISKRSGVKRPTTYLVLNSLESKGFVSRTVRSKKTYFLPQHPKKLITEAELRLKELNEIVPQLESVFQKASGRPRVMIYEGKEELDRANDEIFVVKGEVLFMGTLRLSKSAFPRTFRKFEYTTLSKEFNSRELIDDSEEGRQYAKEVSKPFREVKFIPKELLPFEVDMCIFGNRTLITSVKKEYFTVAIESDEISRAFRTIFEVMWKTAKD